MDLTQKSNDNINLILKEYSSLMTYSFSDTYFMKLIYSLLSKAEEGTTRLTLHHASSIEPSTIHLPKEIEKEIQKHKFDHYAGNMKIGDITFDLNIYTQDPLGKMISMIQLVLLLCAKHAPLKQYTITFYMTSMTKHLEDTVDPVHINSGYSNDQEIVIFRKEEWFKVFIHECFHLFCLDFKEIDLDYKSLLKPMFHLESEYILNEAFVEFWARTLNVAIFSFFIKKNLLYEDFERYFHVNLNVERAFGVVQMKRYLSHFNLEYKELIDGIRKDYKESTNGFCYYVITAILFFHFQQTMNWFVDHNETLLQFQRKPKHVYLFCHYLKSIYSQDKFLKQIDSINEFPKSLFMSAFELTHSSQSGKKGSAED